MSWLFKKKKDVPPEIIGEEETKESEPKENQEKREIINMFSEQEKDIVDSIMTRRAKQQFIPEIEKLKAQVEALNEMREAYNEKLSNISERIGELRSAILENEKKIGEIDAKATQS